MNKLLTLVICSGCLLLGLETAGQAQVIIKVQPVIPGLHGRSLVREAVFGGNNYYRRRGDRDRQDTVIIERNNNVCCDCDYPAYRSRYYRNPNRYPTQSPYGYAGSQGYQKYYDIYYNNYRGREN